MSSGSDTRTAFERWFDDDLQDGVVETPTHVVRLTVEYELDLQVPPWRDLDEALGEVLSTLPDGGEFATAIHETYWRYGEPELLMPGGRYLGATGTIEAAES